MFISLHFISKGLLLGRIAHSFAVLEPRNSSSYHYVLQILNCYRIVEGRKGEREERRKGREARKEESFCSVQDFRSTYTVILVSTSSAESEYCPASPGMVTSLDLYAKREQVKSKTLHSTFSGYKLLLHLYFLPYNIVVVNIARKACLG